MVVLGYGKELDESARGGLDRQIEEVREAK
jgi:hypothetical protein